MLLLRRSWILARSRRFMRIAARLNLAFDIAGLAAGTQQVLEAIVVRFQVIVSHAPILNGHIRIEEVLAVALACAGCQLKVVSLKTVSLAVPMHHGAAKPGTGQKRLPTSNGQS